MRLSRSLGPAAAALLSLSPVASAMAWPRWLPALDTLVVRQNTPSSTSAGSSAVPTVTASASASASNSASPSITGPNTTGNLNTGSIATGSATGTQTGSGATTSTHQEFNPEDPAGGVTLISPAITLGTQLYKIGDYVTWQWNYTSLQATPTGIDILVSCSTVSETWTLTQNMSFVPTGAFTWDTGAYQQTAVASPLLTEQYTLIIYDTDSSISTPPEAGYLAPFEGFQFGMYTPQPYTPLADWTCVTCNAAMSDNEKRAMGFALTMSIVTVLSFTWFVTGLGIM